MRLVRIAQVGRRSQLSLLQSQTSKALSASSLRFSVPATNITASRQPSTTPQTRSFSSSPLKMAPNESLTRAKLFDLTGKTALVTGGGSGIGLMITQTLASNGCTVYISGRTASKLDTVVSTYSSSLPPGGEIIPITADVTTKDGVRSLRDAVEARVGDKGLSILVNNAGVSSEHVTVAEVKDETDSASAAAAKMCNNLFDKAKSNFEDWESTYRTNVAGVYFVTAAFLPLLQRSSDATPAWSATVLNISSISGMVKTAQHHFSYNASKGAAIHLTRMLASEIAEAGLKIRVNGIAPGVFPSEMTANESDESQKSSIPKEKFEGKVPAARPGKDEDMAQAALMFVANQYLNGQTLAVDGGYTLAAGL